MDPNATLKELRYLADKLNGPANVSETEVEEASCRMAELVAELDNWLRRGGLLPSAWEHSR